MPRHDPSGTAKSGLPITQGVVDWGGLSGAAVLWQSHGVFVCL